MAYDNLIATGNTGLVLFLAHSTMNISGTTVISYNSGVKGAGIVLRFSELYLKGYSKFEGNKVTHGVGSGQIVSHCLGFKRKSYCLYSWS